MKILSNFNTKLDEEKLMHWIKEYWKALLIKRHKLFLIEPFFMFLIASIIFLVLIWILYYEFYEKNLVIFFIMSFLYFIWIWIWIFLTFKNFLNYFKNYSFLKTKIDEKDLEDWEIEKFFKHSLVLMFYQIILLIWNSIVSFYYMNDIMEIFLILLQIILNISFIYLLLKVLKKIIDFEMDFTIITPKNITFYNQSWLLKRESKTIDIEKIKSISVHKKWLIRSLFNFWEIRILTEWDESWQWELILKYIPSPEKVKEEIFRIIELRIE